MFKGFTLKDWVIGYFTLGIWILYKMHKNGVPIVKVLGGFVGVYVLIGVLGGIFGDKDKNKSSNTETETVVVEKKVDNAEAERVAKEKATAERIAKEKAEAERLAKEKAEAERIAKEESNKKVAQITTHKIDGYMFVVAAHYEDGSKDVLGIDEKCGYQLSEFKSENDEKESKMFLLKMENAYISIWPTNVYVGCEYGEKCAKSKNFITDEIKTESVLHNKFPLDKKAVRKLSDAIELCQQYGFKHKRFEDYTQYFR